MVNKKRPEIAVGVLVYNNNKEIFLAKSYKWGDRWTVPGGHLEYGETLFECVQREVKEETNLDVSNPEIIDIQDSIYSKEYHKKCHMVFLDYCCKKVSNDIKLNDELQEFIWIKPKESLKRLNLNSSTRKFIEKFIEKNGIKIETPLMPEPWQPVYKKFKTDDNTTLVIFIKRVLAIGLVLLGVVLLAGCGQQPTPKQKISTKNQLVLKQIVPEKTITPGNAKYARPEVININGHLYFAFEKAGGNLSQGERNFELVELNKNLSYKNTVKEIFSGNGELIPHDIRLATDGTKIWYAFETIKPQKSSICSDRYLNLVKYGTDLTNPSTSNLKIIDTNECNKNPEAMDDPAPIYYNGEYIVITRGLNGPIQHVRKFNNNLDLTDHFTLDLSILPAMRGKTLSQNALVNINENIYIVGGLIDFNNPGSESGIYAIQLSNDLRKAVGIINLISEPGKAFKKVNSAKFINGKLYINYVEAISKNQYHHLGVFDINNNFKLLAQIQFQDESFQINHASIEVLGDQIYTFYNKGSSTGNHDIYGQVYELQK